MENIRTALIEMGIRIAKKQIMEKYNVIKFFPLSFSGHNCYHIPLWTKWHHWKWSTKSHGTLENSSAATLQWCHNEHGGISNHLYCSLSHLFRHRSKKTSKRRVTGLCAGNSLVTGEFPVQRASNAENVSIWWRHHWNQIFLEDLGQYHYYWCLGSLCHQDISSHSIINCVI